MTYNVKRLLAMAAVSSLTSIAISHFRKHPPEIEIIKRDVFEESPTAIFGRLSKEAKEWIEENGLDVPHPNPEVQKLIDMDDDTYDRLLNAIRAERREWVNKNGIGQHIRYSLRLHPAKIPEYNTDRYLGKKAENMSKDEMFCSIGDAILVNFENLLHDIADIFTDDFNPCHCVCECEYGCENKSECDSETSDDEIVNEQTDENCHYDIEEIDDITFLHDLLSEEDDENEPDTAPTETITDEQIAEKPQNTKNKRKTKSTDNK